MLADLGFDLSGHFRILFEKIFDLFFALSQTNLAVGIPGAAFVDNVKLCTQIYAAAFMRNTLTVHNIKFCLLERRSDFIFNDFNSGTVADHIVTVFQSFNPSYVHTDG